MGIAEVPPQSVERGRGDDPGHDPEEGQDDQQDHEPTEPTHEAGAVDPAAGAAGSADDLHLEGLRRRGSGRSGCCGRRACRGRTGSRSGSGSCGGGRSGAEVELEGRDRRGAGAGAMGLEELDLERAREPGGQRGVAPPRHEVSRGAERDLLLGGGERHARDGELVLVAGDTIGPRELYLDFEHAADLVAAHTAVDGHGPS